MLELRNIDCIRGARTLFSGLDLRLQPGQLLRVQGANGAGKTSLLRLICGLLAPARGEVLWRGERLADLREEFGRELVYIGHAAALKDDLSALENLRTAALLGGHAATPAAARAALASAGLGGRETTPARLLSQGQRRRLALARLLIGAPPLWVLDEPFDALDSSALQWLRELIAGHLGRGGIVVLSSHQEVALDTGLAPMVVAL
ncbi:cytochrome c biogenesis heme-transporting ATPase CcmA [Rivibacter subsaxonicus]|uniref:Heme exporter protein A n=1 Tax=Rivibacter subsaxonicus TaxID=457575 RepID=A0A4Q7W2V4_9BURK|nr:cytochrome c biogenesis heme-transporting ATPase CcmA [Rivibacter subsaxonicus]RZU03089.1 heme exporter protein A [Rivibacter subsaxonicus]